MATWHRGKARGVRYPETGSSGEKGKGDSKIGFRRKHPAAGILENWRRDIVRSPQIRKGNIANRGKNLQMATRLTGSEKPIVSCHTKGDRRERGKQWGDAKEQMLANATHTCQRGGQIGKLRQKFGGDD